MAFPQALSAHPMRKLHEAALYDHVDKSFEYASDLSGLPVYMSCHCEDPHIPETRVKRSADVLRHLGQITLNLHPGAHHMVMPVDVEIAGPMLCGLNRLMSCFFIRKTRLTVDNSNPSKHSVGLSFTSILA